MINNKELIIPLLEFPHKDIFYFIQVLQRKKENSVLGNNSRLIKAYFITSVDKLEKQWDEMVKLAEVFNARVMINLNPRNFRKAGFHLLQKIANSMSNDDFHNLYKAYTSVCGEYHSEIDKRWLVDIDNADKEFITIIEHCINLQHREITYINYNESKSQVTRNILATLPSKSGYHIITNPFNLENFKAEYPEIEVHKNNPVNLYIP